MKSILFVDDNQMLCRLSCDILQREGYHTVGAYSGADALTAFEREPFDMVVTDLRMQGMDGLELARAIRKKDPSVPVILVTAYEPVESEDIIACLPKEELFPKLLHRIRLSLADRSLAENVRKQ